jgi:predicted nucleotidyltransferase
MEKETLERVTILKGITGSKAYGMDTEKSDIDIFGIFVEPTKQILGFRKGEGSYCFTEPDATYHEIGRFCELCLKGNPTAIEFLWLENYLQITEEGKELISLREKFLSKKIRNSYIGYVYSQIQLYGRGDNQARKEKNIRHCFRLMEQAEILFSTGKLVLKVRDREEIFFLARQSPTFELNSIVERLEKLKRMDDVLPEEPEEKSIEDFLLEVRRNHFE